VVPSPLQELPRLVNDWHDPLLKKRFAWQAWSEVADPPFPTENFVTQVAAEQKAVATQSLSSPHAPPAPWGEMHFEEVDEQTKGVLQNEVPLQVAPLTPEGPQVVLQVNPPAQAAGA